MVPRKVNEQIVFLYYNDLAVADRFFGQLLGFRKTTDQEWVKIYQPFDGSSVGAVLEGRSARPTGYTYELIEWR